LNSGGYIVSHEYKSMHYAWGSPLIPTTTEWLEVICTAACDLKKIPAKGRNYSCAFGLSSSLTENFLVRRKIKGPQYVIAKNLVDSESFTLCPMFAVQSIDDISLNSERCDALPPPMNICTISIRTYFDEQTRQHEIFALSIRVFLSCNMEQFNENCVHTFISKPSSSATPLCKDIPTDRITICHSERQLLTRFVRAVDLLDIDFMAGYSMITNDIPLLFNRMRICKVQEWFKIGRINRDTPIKGNYVNKLLCFSGRIPVDIRDGCVEFLKLRANDLSSIALQELGIKRQQIDHLNVVDELADRKRLLNLVKYTETDTAILAMMMQKIQLLQICLRISQVSGCLLARVFTCKQSIRCESYLVHSFSERNFVIPDKIYDSASYSKEPKYRGGTVLQPKKGFYDTCIVLLDFNSLYPSVISEYNLCFTTVSRHNPTAEEAMQKKRGVLPEIMEELKEMRDTLKKQLEHSTGLDSERLIIKQQAIKVLANAIYGHIGQTGSRFQCTEIAALVTERGRVVLQETVDQVESTGKYSIIYGDTDSVMIDTGTKDAFEANRIANELSQEIQSKYKYLKLGVNGIFTKMLLVTKKKYAVMVYDIERNTRYQEVKGLDMVRRDWCALTKYLSSFVLDQMMNESRETCIQNVMDELSHVSYMLTHNGVPRNQDSGQLSKITKEMLIIYRQLNKNINEYSEKKQNPHVAIAIRMKARGEPLPPHATIPMIITSPQLRELCDKVKLPDEVEDVAGCDSSWYLLNQIMPPICRLFEPYGGVNNASIARALGMVAIEQPKYANSFENSLLSTIPHITELCYSCLKCGQPVIFSVNYASSMRCMKCGAGHSWKPVANQLIRFIRRFIKEQIQTYKCPDKSCEFTTQYAFSYCPIHDSLVECRATVDVHSTLRYFAGLFVEKRIITEDDEDFEDFRAYMQTNIKRFLSKHGYNHVNLSSLIV
jgi:DNA polymerase alpha subunit A